jgi:hypothetical protein
MRKSRRSSAPDPAQPAPNSNFAWMYTPTYLPDGTTTGGSPAPGPPPAPAPGPPDPNVPPPPPLPGTAWQAPAAASSYPPTPPPAYPPPSYAPPAYPPPAYAPVPYAPPGAPANPWAPAPPQGGSRHAALIIGSIVAVLVVAAGVLTVTLVRRANEAVSLPDQIGQYTVLNTPSTQAEVTQLVQVVRAGGSKHATAKIYSTDGLTQDASAFVGDLPSYLHHEPDVAVNVVNGFVTSFTAGTSAAPATVADTGPNGGYMECGLRPVSLESVSFCAWSDGATISEVSVTHGTVAEAHSLALQVRAANGH